MSARAAGLPGKEAVASAIRGAILWLTLVLSCVLGLLTPYLLGLIGIAVLVVSLVRGTYLGDLRQDGAAQLFLATFLGLGICFAITAAEPGDIIYALNFIALVLYAPVAALMRRGARAGNTTRVADLALAGTVAAFLAALAGIAVFGWPRAESPIFGAILLANTTLILGFLALIGIVAGGARRWLYLLGPVLGVAVVAMTGSRGPLLALVPLTLVAAVFVARALRLRPLLVAGAALAYLAVSGVFVFALESRSATLIAAVGEVLGDPLRGPGGGAVSIEPPGAAARAAPDPVAPAVPDDTGAAAERQSGGPEAEAPAAGDTTTNIRLALYEAGLQAFLERPFFGHGWARLMAAADPHLAAEYKAYAEELPQLHNDVINFAVAAGLAGVALYLLLLVTPLAAVLAGPRDSAFPARLYGTAVLTTAYFFDGLTDLMFGFEYHTAFFVFVAAILLGYCRDAVASGRAANG